MRTAILAMLALALADSVFGQSAAPITVAAVQTGASQPKWSVTNTGSTTVTAFALTYALPVPQGSNVAGADATILYDAATEPLANKPVPPGQTVTLPYGPSSAGVGQALPQVRAAVLADGTAWGDSLWCARIARRRGYMEKYLRASITELMQASSAGVADRSQLSSQFQAALAAETAAAVDADDRACATSVRGVILRNLQQARTGNLVLAPVNLVLQHEIDAAQLRLSAILAYGGGK
jgi:hypothetical protein